MGIIMNRDDLYKQFGPMIVEALMLIQDDRDKVLTKKINQIAKTLNIEEVNMATPEQKVLILKKRLSRLNKYNWMEGIK